MGKFSPCVFRNIKGWRLEPERPWFEDVCRRKRRIFYALWGTVERIYGIQRKSTESIRGGLHANYQNNTAICLDKLSKRDPAIYDMLKQRKTTCPSPVPTDAWNTYLLSHFHAKPPPGLKCETGLYGWSPDRNARVCNLSENGDYIQIEKHVIFSCMGTEHLRHQFNHLFENISEGDIKGFVFQQQH